MVPPNTINCSFCQRLYSVYSLQLHETRCSENPVNRPETTENRSKQPGSLKKRRNTVSATGRTRSTLTVENREIRQVLRSQSIENATSTRPSTHTVTSNLSISSTDPGECICFVCGRHYKSVSINDHARRCELEWHKLRASLPSHMQTHAPFTIQIPSIDGTVDIRRLDEIAAASAAQAQLALCQRCKTKLAFSTANIHRCPHYKPTVRFYF